MLYYYNPQIILYNERMEDGCKSSARTIVEGVEAVIYATSRFNCTNWASVQLCARTDFTRRITFRDVGLLFFLSLAYVMLGISI